MFFSHILFERAAVQQTLQLVMSYSCKACHFSVLDNTHRVNSSDSQRTSILIAIAPFVASPDDHFTNVFTKSTDRWGGSPVTYRYTRGVSPTCIHSSHILPRSCSHSLTPIKGQCSLCAEQNHALFKHSLDVKSFDMGIISIVFYASSLPIRLGLTI